MKITGTLGPMCQWKSLRWAFFGPGPVGPLVIDPFNSIMHSNAVLG